MFRNLKISVFDNFKHGNSAITHVKPIKSKQGPAMQKIADISSLFQVKNDQKPIFFKFLTVILTVFWAKI